jgi:hypothetical protein
LCLSFLFFFLHSIEYQLYIHIHALYSFSAWITSSVFLFSKISPSSSSSISISFSFSSFVFLFYLIKSIGLVCILVNIYPLGLTCYFFVSISCDASIVVTTSLFVTNPLISEATVVIKCTTYRTNTVDIPPDQKTSHTLFVRYSIPLQISDLTNNTQIHTFFIRIKFLSIFLHLFTLNSFYEISNNRCSLASFSFFLA